MVTRVVPDPPIGSFGAQAPVVHPPSIDTVPPSLSSGILVNTYRGVRLNPRNLAQLQLGDAVAAILITVDRCYLLQLRDDIPGIWYPGHWGLFGGSVDAGESDIEALRRELREEIELDLDAQRANLFTRFDFDLRPAGLRSYFRSYYEISLRREELELLVLHEGVEMRSFSGDEALALKLSPYDSFALFLHHQRERLTALPRS